MIGIVVSISQLLISSRFLIWKTKCFEFLIIIFEKKLAARKCSRRVAIRVGANNNVHSIYVFSLNLHLRLETHWNRNKSPNFVHFGRHRFCSPHFACECLQKLFWFLDYYLFLIKLNGPKRILAFSICIWSFRTTRRFRQNSFQHLVADSFSDEMSIWIHLIHFRIEMILINLTFDSCNHLSFRITIRGHAGNIIAQS